jgi:hypothetical protein
MDRLRSLRRLLLVFVLFCLSGAAEAAAQHAPTPTIALELLRRNGSGEAVSKVLGQDSGIQAPDALDRLAEALIQIAADFEGDDPNIMARKRAVNSVHALEYAGSSRATVRYQGALSGLRAIVEQGKDKPVRSLALQAMLSVTDVAPLIPYLTALATSQDVIADHAVSMLMRYAGDGGRTELRRLHREKLVVEANAKELLAMIASANNW